MCEAAAERAWTYSGFPGTRDGHDHAADVVFAAISVMPEFEDWNQ